MVGHFAVFNSWTEISSLFEGRFLEQVAPGAFRKTFAEGGQRVLLAHGHDPALGERPIAVPEQLAEDGVGASYRARLLPGVPDLVVAGIAAGQYGSSFRFKVMVEDLVAKPGVSDRNPAGLPERTLVEVAVSEFGPCPFPAYRQATASIEGAAA